MNLAIPVNRELPQVVSMLKTYQFVMGFVLAFIVLYLERSFHLGCHANETMVYFLKLLFFIERVIAWHMD